MENKYGISVLVVITTIISMLSAQISFEIHVIESELDLVSSTSIADIDGDGNQDIVNTSWDTNELLWWRNSGVNPILWEQNTISDTLLSASFVVHTDIDNDNDIDLVVSGWGDNSINIFINNGSISTDWEILNIDDSFNWAHEVRVADIDNDGFTDIIGVSTNLNTIAWWKNPGSVGLDEWTKYVIENQCIAVRTVYPGDLNNDGRIDLVTASFDANNISWYKNNPDLTWTKYEIEDLFIHPHMVHITDLNSDGYLDIISAGYSGFPNNEDITCWLNDGLNQDDWTRFGIDKQFNGALGVTSADIDLDGDMDIIGTAELNTNTVAVWLNNSDATEWEKIIIDDLLNGAWGVSCGDVDSDGDIDISSGGENHLVWYENTSQLALSVENETVSNEIFISSYPNPFNPITTLTYGLDRKSKVSVAIYDVTGKLIDTLLNKEQQIGTHNIEWNGTNKNNEQVHAGIYFCKIISNEQTKTVKMMLVK